MKRKITMMEGGPVSENGFEHAITIAEMRTDVPECDLHGLSVPDAERTADIFLDKAFRKNSGVVKIIHGKGQGVLAKTMEKFLSGHDLVEYSRQSRNGGEMGAVIYAVVDRMDG